MSVYYYLYDILGSFLYGDLAHLTNYEELSLSLISSCGAIFILIVPFFVAYLLVKVIINLFNR